MFIKIFNFVRGPFSIAFVLILAVSWVIPARAMEDNLPALAGAFWYVAPTGSDANSCSTPTSRCATLRGVITKAGVGDIIYVASGIYTNTVDTLPVAQISKNITLLGGWDDSFSAQTGFSTIDGQNTRGGIQVLGPTTVTIERFIVENTSSTNGGINNAGNLTINRSIVRRNTASNRGAISSTGNLELNNSSVYENKVPGLYHLGGTLNVNNSTISKNAGAGISVNFSGTVTVNNSTVANNTSGVGGGIYIYQAASAQVYIKNSIVADNTALQYYPPLPGNMQDCYGVINSLGNNIIKTPTNSCNISGGSNDKIRVDPQLGDFLIVDGVGYQPLSANSPAIDAGNPATCLPADQRDTPRYGVCDIGAYEYTPPGPAADILMVSGDDQYAEIGRPFLQSLKVAISDASGRLKSGASVTFTAPAVGASGTFPDKHSFTTMVLTDSAGIATAPEFTANSIRGNYVVVASLAGVEKTIQFHLENLAWFVTPNGSDSNSCTSPEMACATIDAAINKAAPGDTIYIGMGTYTPVGTPVSPGKDITLSGGWNESFTAQSGFTRIDGENTKTGLSISNGTATVNVTIDRFEIFNARPGISIYGSTLNINNSSIRNNIAKGSVGGSAGGGISMAGGNLTITNSTISSNTADEGAGIYTYGGSISLLNSTISGNIATQYGGGISFRSSTSSTYINTLKISYSTIAQNRADLDGGGIYQYRFSNIKPVIMDDSILAQNSAPSGADCSSTIEFSFNNIYDTFDPTTCIRESTVFDRIGDPRISPTLSGMPGHHVLLIDSPAIDAGSNMNCPATDQRGVARPHGSQCDIGAYEADLPLIRGNAGVADVTLSYTVGTPKTVKADSLGNYSIHVWVGWSGTVTPAKLGYIFTPISRTYSNVQGDQAGQNYTAQYAGDADTTGVFRPSNGLLYLKNSNQTGFADLALNYGLGGDYPVVGDWDGNGDATIGVYRGGKFYLRNSNTLGFADLVFAFGQIGDQPIAGDWDGDGIDTIGVYRPSNGLFLLRNSNSAGAEDMSFYLGNVGDVGIAGDWDEDGKDTTGVFRPSNGIIFLKNTNETGYADVALNYGIPGDKPVTGDWDNDGIDTIGVYRNGQFLLRNSNTVGFADIVFGLGNPGDMPIAGNWDGIP